MKLLEIFTSMPMSLKATMPLIASAAATPVASSTLIRGMPMPTIPPTSTIRPPSTVSPSFTRLGVGRVLETPQSWEFLPRILGFTPGLAAAPVLKSPQDGANLSGETITFRWTWFRALKEDEYFCVLVISTEQGQFHYSIALVKEPWLETGGLSTGNYYWGVAVMRDTGTTPDGMQGWEAVSEESEVRSFIYSPPGPPAEPSNPPLVTPEW